MTREDILVLAKAGFTAAQIAALSSVQQPNTQPPTTQPVQPPTTQPPTTQPVQPPTTQPPTTQPVQPPTTQPPTTQPVQQPATQPNFNGYMDKMDELIRTVQASNVAASRNNVRVETTDDILAAIINPPTLDKGGAK